MIKNPFEKRILNPEQKKAVEFGDGPLLIIAGAGTGKTTVVTERIKYLINSGKAKPQEILALTFTEKASREMEERIDLSLSYGLAQMWISTFHSFCDRILRNEGLAIGLDPNFKLMTEAESIQFFRIYLFQFDLQYFRPLGNPTKFISGILQHFSRLKDEDVSCEEYKEWVKDKRLKMKDKKNEEEEIKRFEELANAYRTYEALKTKYSLMDYGDLIAYVLHLFRTRKTILKKYQEQFKYILIDEFQDTNFAQNEMAILLSGKKQNITVVGDDDQAIYRWRGAAISNMIQFRKHFKKAAIVVLTKNYRSTKEILDRSYQMIQNNNPDRLEIAEHIEKKLECARRVNGKPIQFVYTERVEDEAEKVALMIKNLAANSKKEDGTLYQWKDAAILVRANAHAEPFVRALSQCGIPYQFLGPGQLFRQAEVKDLICYLKVLYDISDTVSLFRVLSMDYFTIPPRDIAALLSYGRQHGMTLFEACEIISGNSSIENPIRERPFVTPDGQQKIKKLFSIILKHLGLLKKESAGQILYFFLEESGLLQSFTSYNTVKEERVAENIAKFFDKLKTYEVDHENASVFVVVDWLELCMTLGESPLAANSDWNTYDAVNILTIHSAKGLEFPIVFVVNLVGARFPTSEKHEQIPIPDALVKEILPQGDYHLEEERRLFYVAATRSRDYLYLTAAKYYGEGKREKKISPFVFEILPENNIQDVVAEEKQKDSQLLLIDWKKIEEPEIQEVHTPITYLSYSQVEAFERCPLQYKYRYVLKIPVPTSAALLFGDTVHRTLHRFYDMKNNDVPVDEQTLLDIYEKEWKVFGYKDKVYAETMKKHGVELLKEFYKNGFDENSTVLELEQPFKIRLTPTLVMGGKIDRVDRTKDGKLEIIDYKTGSAPKKRDPKTDTQLSVYALAATEKSIYGEKPENVIVSFYFLEGNEKISATRELFELNQVKEKMKKIADEIYISKFPPTSGNHCDFCEFRLICQAWK